MKFIKEFSNTNTNLIITLILSLNRHSFMIICDTIKKIYIICKYSFLLDMTNTISTLTDMRSIKQFYPLGVYDYF